MAGIVLHAAGIQGSQAPPDARHQMGAVYEEAGFVLPGIGGSGLIFVGGGGTYRYCLGMKGVKGLINSIFVDRIQLAEHESPGHRKALPDQLIQAFCLASYGRIGGLGHLS